MDERGAGDAMVDVCSHCRGLWIDWFDGDTVDVAMKAAPLSVRAPVALDLTKAFCPRCLRLLTFTNHAIHEYASGPLTDHGPLLLRCGECMGTFVPRTVFDELIELANTEEEDTRPDSPLGKLLAVIRRLLMSEQ